MIGPRSVLARTMLAGLLLSLPLARAQTQTEAAKPKPIEPIALAAADAAAVQTPSAADAWGGPRTANDATLSDRVVEYTIDVSLDPQTHRIEGRERLTWRNRSAQPIDEVYLHLYLNAFKGEDSTFFTEQRERGFRFRSDVPVRDGEWGWIDMTRVEQAGQAVSWMPVQPDGGPATDSTVVCLKLAQPVPPGKTTSLDIEFRSQLPRVIARTGWFGSFHLVAQWFPKIAVLELPGERGADRVRWNAHEFHLHSEFYADFANFDVRLTVPEDYQVGATGKLQGIPERKDGKATWHFVQGDVIDFAWMADNRYGPPLTSTWQGEGSPNVQIHVLYPPEYADNAKPVMQATRDALDWFSRTLGPYPYETVTAVIPPFNAREAGGMEYPTFFTADSYANLKPGSLQAHNLDFVTIHEFGHGYFMGLLASNEFEEPMLDEGLNEYWDNRMLDARGQKVPLLPRWLQALGLRLDLSQFELERLGAMLSEPSDGIGANSWDRMSSRGYGSVYSRTAIVMHDLEAQLGKEVIERAFKTYYERWKFRHPSIADLREVLAEVSGERALIDRVFAQQVYAATTVDDRIVSLTSDEVLPRPGTRRDDGVHVETTQKQVDKKIAETRKAWKKTHPDAKPGSGPYPWLTRVLVARRGAAVPQTLVVKFADGSEARAQFDGSARWQRFTWTRDARAVSAQLDPDGKHWLDVSKADDSRLLQPDSTASRRWSADAATVLQTLFAQLVNL